MTRAWRHIGAGCMAVLAMGGCALKLSQRSPWDIEQIERLSQELEHFRSLAQLNAEEAGKLRDAKAELERGLGSNQGVSIGYDERGLVIRVVDQVLFDSGKAKLRGSADGVLAKVARILQEEVPDQPIGVEGHTDNEPITKSGWKDNWELSLARARSVLTTLVAHGVSPSRVAATGYGEYRPIGPNDTASGRAKNRRVEIVVWPQGTSVAQRQEGGLATNAKSDGPDGVYRK